MVDHVYCINLARRTDRWRRLSAALRRRGLCAERFLAIDGQHLDPARVPPDLVRPDYDTSDNARWDAGVQPGRRRRLSPGEIGCALSHLAVWDDLLRRDLRCALVLEDDAVPVRGFAGRLTAHLAALPRGWHLSYLGYLNVGPPPEPRGPLLGVPRHLFGTFGYLLSRAGARRLLGMLPVEEPIDNFMAARFARLAVSCALDPLVVHHHGSDSDVRHSAR